MPSQEELMQKLEVCKMLFTNPMEVIKHIEKNPEIDWVQMAITTLIAVVFGMITYGAGGFYRIIGTPISIFVGAVILLLFSLIASGKTDYVKLVNLASYMALITAFASLVARIPIVSAAASTLVSFYAIYIQFIGLPYLTDCKKEIIKVIVIIEVLIVGAGLILGVVGSLGVFIFRSLCLF